MHDVSPPGERPDSRKSRANSRGAAKYITTEKNLKTTITYANNDKNVIIVKGGGPGSGSGNLIRKQKTRKPPQNEATAHLNKKYMDELLTREKKNFDNQITSLKIQHEKIQDDIFKQQQTAIKDR
jgi:hypothetical protein